MDATLTSNQSNGKVGEGTSRTNGGVQSDTKGKGKPQKHSFLRGKSLDSETEAKTAATPNSEVVENKLRQRGKQQETPRSKDDSSVSPLLYSPTVDFKMQMIIIGDRNVGKTCFLERYTNDKFNEESKSTVGIDFKMKNVTVAGRRIRLQIWDTAGQERFNSITTAYYRNARGILIVYDVTKPESYRNLTKWLDLVQEYARSDAEIAIVGNKADLPDGKVNTSKARHFAENYGYLFYETSAKESLNIDTVFVNLIYKVIKQIPQPHERNPRIKRKTDASEPLSGDSTISVRNSCC